MSLETVQLALGEIPGPAAGNWLRLPRVDLSRFRRSTLAVNVSLTSGIAHAAKLKIFTSSGASGSFRDIEDKVLLYAFDLSAPLANDYGEFFYDSVCVSLDMPLSEIFLEVDAQGAAVKVDAKLIGEPLN